MDLHYLIVFGCIILQAERGLFDFISYLKLFNQLSKKQIKKYGGGKRDLYILIPALNEQTIIEDTVLKICKIKNDYFKINVAILTTAKEDTNSKKENKRTTEDVLKDSLKSGRLSEYKKNIHIFKDHNLGGNMATQLNYGINELKSFLPLNTYYLVLNADSTISSATFNSLGELVNKHLNKDFAFQQPCAFVRDMNKDANQFTNAMSLYQSWYCLGHESRIVRKYSTLSEKKWSKNNNTQLGVVVGHGSGMTLGINLDNGGYPSDLLTEDLTFGFNLSVNSVPILSSPALEIADVPDKFAVFIKQKSVWFWNFLGYLKCYRSNLDKGHSRYRLFLLLVQGLRAGAYWFFDTFFIIIPFMIGIIEKSNLILIISLVSFIIFYILPQYILYLKLPKVLSNQGFSHKASDVSNVSFLKLLPFLCLIIFTNSVGAWIATIKFVKYLFTGKLPVKYKTGD